MNTVCYNCLNNLNSDLRHNIHNTDLYKWICSCTSSPMFATSPAELDTFDFFKDDDDYPKFLCQVCYDTLRSYKKFRDMSLCAMKTLTEIVVAVKQKHTQNDSSSSTDVMECADFSDFTKLDLSEQHKINERIFGETDWHEFDFVNESEEVAQLNEAEKVVKIMRTFEAVKKIMKKVVLKMKIQKKSGKFSDATISKKLVNNASNLGMDKQTSAPQISNNLTEVKQTNFANKIKQIKTTVREQLGATTTNAKDCTEKEKYLTNEKSRAEKSATFCEKNDNINAKNLRDTNSDAKNQRKIIDNLLNAGLEVFQCEKCPQQFDEHKFEHNELNPQSSFCQQQQQREQEEEDVAKPCPECLLNNATKNKKRTKTLVKKNVCEYCGLTFRDLSLLEKHRLKHPPHEYPFQCEKCWKRFSVKQTYQKHMQLHETMKRYKCPLCAVCTATTHKLRAHINSHTKESQEMPTLFCKS